MRRRGMSRKVMGIDHYIKEEREALERAYKEIGNRVYWKTRYGDEVRVADMPSKQIVECLDMLDRVNPNSYWNEVFEHELRTRGV